MGTKIHPHLVAGVGISIVLAGVVGVLAGQTLAHRNTIRRDAFAAGYAAYAREQARRLD
ncbi:hypothetical protein [Dactylosporangium sp. NPDC000521]|uniref:hypothetical protein n=1 Tax=Dactylosporangium sp. NPDC000521 TaxID=3363975 RepID=UPI00369A7077